MKAPRIRAGRPWVVVLLAGTSVVGWSVTMAIALGGLQSRVLAQGVTPENGMTDGQEHGRPKEPGWIEVLPANSNVPLVAGSEKAVRTMSVGLRLTDFDRVKAAVPSIKKVVPIREAPMRISHLEHVLDGRMVSTSFDDPALKHVEVQRGRSLGPSDEAKHRDFAVIGSEIAAALFPNEDPVGQRFKVGPDSFMVVGVAKQLAGDGRNPQVADRNVYVPFTGSGDRLNDWLVATHAGTSQATQLSRILVQVHDDATLEETARLIRSALKPFHPRGGVEVVIVKPEARANKVGGR